MFSAGEDGPESIGVACFLLPPDAPQDGAEGADKATSRLAGFLSPVRSSAALQVGVAILIGAAAGLCVSLMSFAAEAAHVLIYDIALDESSAATTMSPQSRRSQASSAAAC